MNIHTYIYMYIYIYICAGCVDEARDASLKKRGVRLIHIYTYIYIYKRIHMYI